MKILTLAVSATQYVTIILKNKLNITTRNHRKLLLGTLRRAI